MLTGCGLAGFVGLRCFTGLLWLRLIVINNVGLYDSYLNSLGFVTSVCLNGLLLCVCFFRLVVSGFALLVDFAGLLWLLVCLVLWCGCLVW